MGPEALRTVPAIEPDVTPWAANGVANRQAMSITPIARAADVVN